MSVDANYMFTAEQRVRNTGDDWRSACIPGPASAATTTPKTAGYYILHEGLLGVLDGRLQEQTYEKAKTESNKTHGASLDMTTTGGWVGITDKYWLTALIPDQAVPQSWRRFRHVTENNSDRYQTDFLLKGPGGHRTRRHRQQHDASCLLAPKSCSCLTATRASWARCPNFDKAVDFRLVLLS